MEDTMKLGSRIQVRRQHWWRQGEKATVIEMHSTGRFTVEFDTPGVGFDDGRHLILGVEDVEEIIGNETN